MKRITLMSAYTVCLTFYSSAMFGHGIIEKPASREQFCGVETRPEQIYSKLTHEECRPMLTKSDGTLDNSIYNFMAVLTHTTGRQGRTATTLPNNVCGFDSENWGKGKTPWDKAMAWPVNRLTSGTNQFVWNIGWGNHFSDTEEFAYWITKPGFVFNKDKELLWSDFEDQPFCVLKYDDRNPTANPAIVADKSANKFITSCTVPARQGRAVIYGEWGRNRNTFERFHSCIDVVFDGGTSSPVVAAITPVPSTVTGATEMILDASSSTGNNLAYQWSVLSGTPALYTLYDANKVKARLVIKNPPAEQRVSVNLTVYQGTTSNNTSTSFMHLPLVNDTWKLVGTPTEINTLAAGDKISLRMIDTDGRDIYLPATPLVLDSVSANSLNWGYALAQVVNGQNSYSVRIGVLDPTTGKVEPIHSATANKIYVPGQSGISNAYIFIQKNQTPSTGCRIQKKSGASAWWMGYDIFVDKTPVTLDFSATGIDLTKINIDRGVFSDVKVLSSTRLIINSKPTWVSKTTPGYMGFLGSNYAPLSTSIVADCLSG